MEELQPNLTNLVLRSINYDSNVRKKSWAEFNHCLGFTAMRVYSLTD